MFYSKNKFNIVIYIDRFLTVYRQSLIYYDYYY